MWTELDARGLTTEAAVYQALADAYANGGATPYGHVVLDEAQDASAAQLWFLARLVGHRPNGLFFAGDLGQSIFQQPFSWLSVGVGVRGRARTLKVNYRTSHQIRTRADRLLDARTDDVDGETQARRGTISVFNGPEPRVERFVDGDAEARAHVGLEGAGDHADRRTGAGGAVQRRDHPVLRAGRTPSGTGAHLNHVDEQIHALEPLRGDFETLRARCRGGGPVAACGVWTGLASLDVEVRARVHT